VTDASLSILIVEDEPPVRALLTEILRSKYQCSGVESAAEAIGLMDSRFFHLALVDIGLPGMSGLGLCRLIVNRSPETVVVVVSGNTDDQSVADAIKAGAADYITKPFNLSHALATIERAIGCHSPGAVA
jgi:DNA-binding response OmpR family regulator